LRSKKEDIELLNEYRNVAHTRVKDLSSKLLTINYRELDHRVKLLARTIWEPYNKARNNVFVRRDVLIKWNAMNDKRTCATRRALLLRVFVICFCLLLFRGFSLPFLPSYVQRRYFLEVLAPRGTRLSPPGGHS